MYEKGFGVNLGSAAVVVDTKPESLTLPANTGKVSFPDDDVNNISDSRSTIITKIISINIQYPIFAFDDGLGSSAGAAG